MSNAFDWNHFHQLFEQFFQQGTKTGVGTNLDLSWINKHMEETLNSALPPYTQNHRKGYTSEIIEIHNYVIVKIKIPKSDTKKIQLKVSSSRLQIINTETHKKEILSLPALIRTDTSKAIYSNGVLEVRLMKLESYEKFFDVDIRFI